MTRGYIKCIRSVKKNIGYVCGGNKKLMTTLALRDYEKESKKENNTINRIGKFAYMYGKTLFTK